MLQERPEDHLRPYLIFSAFLAVRQHAHVQEQPLSNSPIAWAYDSILGSVGAIVSPMSRVEIPIASAVSRNSTYQSWTRSQAKHMHKK